tara:strand:+ start:1102 stop:1767 length:666 start_codon:yes stop_codon:yes gene_type:complete
MILLKDYYKKLYDRHGNSPKSLGWSNGKQFLRFHQLTSNLDLNGSSILDVGCGFGDLIKFLELNNIKDFKYKGVDIMEEFIDEAQKKHPSKDISFIKSKLVDIDFIEKFDFAFASGTFNLKIDGINGYDNIYQNMKKMFDNCNKAIAIDFISSRVEYKNKHNFNSDPLKILEMAYSFSKAVILRNDYFPFEFAIIIYKDDSFIKETTTFNHTEKKLSWLIP